MSKNVIHNFNILIQDSADIKSAEDLTNVMIKELAKVSKEMSQQKDIEQIWQEQKDLKAVINNSVTPVEEGAANTNAKQSRKQKVLDGTTSSVQEKSGLSSSVPIGEGVADTFDRTKMNSVLSANTTSPVSETENGTLNWSSSITTQTYTGLESQETLKVPQTNSNEPPTEVVKAAIKKKLDLANTANDRAAIEYWTKISKAFTEGYTAKDFDGKPNDALFTEMYAALKQSNSATAIQNFNWEIVREKMIKAINANILQGQISEAKKERWEMIRDQLKKDTTNIANLFEQYNELFLLLREVEGLDDLPGTITITTKTKIYPNLRADRLYADIGKEAVYVFLKEINNEDLRGNAVKRGAVKIKNTNASSFIVGESLEFFLDETLIVQNGYKNEDINWIVYKSRKGKKDEETIFEDEGTSFSYNFDTEGTYKIEAYGDEYGANNKKSKKSFAFVEVKIVAQEIVITPPSIVKGKLVRPSAKEVLFKTALKYPKIKTLNPLQFYYQIEVKTANKGTTISDEKELDSTGSIKLVMPDLGTYKIKVISKDQYALAQEFEISAIKNEVTGIGPIMGESNKNLFLSGGSFKPFTLEAKTFKINPATDEERQDVKWIVYDSNNNPYLTSGDIWYTEKDTPKRKYLQKWESFAISVPDKEGHYTVEAFSDIAKGVDAKATFKMQVERPQVTEAYWAYSNGDKKKISGFSGEINHVKASIPGYDNQKVRINFYLNGSKEPYYYNDTTTNESGEIKKIITFDGTFQRRFGVQEGKTAKISFKLMGIQNDKLYPFKKNASVNTAAVLNVAMGEKITAVYFQHDGKRVTAQDEIPLSYDGEYVTIVAKTQNMIGKDIVLTAHRVGEEPIFRSKAKIDSEGNASGTFKITRRKGTKIGEKMSYYVGIEGYSTMHVGYKGLNMVVADFLKEKFDRKNPQLIWGAKVSKEFRVKVVEICERLWPKNTIEMANGLMAVMYRETAGTFAPNQIEGKALIPKEKITKNSFDKYIKGKKYSRAVGLVQFTQDALKSMGEYTGGGLDVLNELKVKYANMNQLEQLVKVEDYMKKVRTLPRIPEDIYMAVFAPAYVGLELNKTIYELGTTDYGENDSLDVDKTKNGIQIKELITEYYESLRNGEYGRNIWRNPLDRMELRGWYSTWRPNDSKFGIIPKRDKGKHEGIDLYASVGTPVHACVDGLIVFNSTAGGYGNTVVLKGYYESKLYYFAYSHLREKSKFIADKSWVKAGEVIGHTGQSGNAESLTSEKTHLHFEVRPLKEWGDKSKEFRGRVNPLEEIKELFVVLDPKKEKQI
ncbi:M23 family metallopeptidase [Flavobacterium sp. T12S277]|uniref:M23 family metallopeptidase n=1 Tax=Flavobacterium sp. T12S277 TaxID=3402752 RepID=UPI003AEAA675